MTSRKSPSAGNLSLVPRAGADPVDDLRDGSGSARATAGELNIAPGPRGNVGVEAPALPEADLSNVIPFAPPHRAEAAVPDVAVTFDARSAPRYPVDRPWRLVSVFVASLVIHGSLLALFGRPPPPLASVGVQSISVEIVLGTNKAAGPSKTDGENAIESAASAEQLMPEDPAIKVAEAATAQPQEVPVAAQEATPSVVAENAQPVQPAAVVPPTQTPSRESATNPAPAKTTDAKPVGAEAIKADATKSAIAMVETPDAELPTSRPQDVEPDARAIAPTSPSPAVAASAQKTMPAEQPIAEAKPVPQPATTHGKRVAEKRVKPDPSRARARARERRRIAARTKERAERRRRSVASRNSRAASGIGRGRSDLNTNYRGIVASRLARQKRYPSDARSAGVQGVATVTFRIGGSGQVSSVRLARSSGSTSLDREVVAMVRRASPFPSPPGRQSMTFTAPVSFRLR